MTGWTIEDGAPGKEDKYEWESSSRDREGVLTDTVAPGDLNVRPEDFDLAPTLAPAITGIQSGIEMWSYESAPDNSWYVIGTSVEDN